MLLLYCEKLIVQTNYTKIIVKYHDTFNSFRNSGSRIINLEWLWQWFLKKFNLIFIFLFWYLTFETIRNSIILSISFDDTAVKCQISSKPYNFIILCVSLDCPKKGYVCVCVLSSVFCVLFTGLVSTNFSKFFFKTRSHGIIHTFKNYFVIVFLVFNDKWYPNRPYNYVVLNFKHDPV